MKTRKVKFFYLWGLLFFISFLMKGCYFTHLSFNQIKVLYNRTPIDKVLENPETKKEVKRKLTLAKEVLLFSKKTLHLNAGNHYKTYVDIKEVYEDPDRLHITYVLKVAHAYDLKPHLWWFPIVGKLPYKGFFYLEYAKEEALKFNPEEYDTYVHGVSAYSSLDWWNSPILSSFLNYDDEDFVEIIIHELVHNTIFIKGHANFNERLATALSNKGTYLFYVNKEGKESQTISKIQMEQEDDRIFSLFISEELDELKVWYQKNKEFMSLDKKNRRLSKIQERFKQDLKPLLKTSKYDFFQKIKLNNARLLSFRTYFYDLNIFEFLFKFYKNDFEEILSFLMQLKSKKDPEGFLKAFVHSKKTEAEWTRHSLQN